jgi:hypothetical protein
VNALRRIHRSLVPGGTLVDVHPVAPALQAEAGGRVLGSFDGSQFFADVATAEGDISGTGLWELEAEARFDLIQRCDSGEEAVEYALGYGGYTVPDEVGRRVLAAEPPVDVREFAVVRRFRAL